MDVRLLQLRKAHFPIEVTELGMVTDVRLRQPEKAASPIEVTEFGMVTDVRLLQCQYLQLIVCQFATRFESKNTYACHAVPYRDGC